MTQHTITVNGTYTGIDIMKFFMALCVIMIHVKSFFHEFAPGAAVNFTISLAVPFFFIASGFLLANKLKEDDDATHISRYSKRIWRMYAIWILIYIPLCILGEYIQHKESGILRFAMVQARSIALFGEIRFSYPTWYLYSLGLATMLIYLFKKRKYNMHMLVVMGIAGILLQYLAPLVDLPKTALSAMLSLSRMTIGLGYVLFGMYIYNNRRLVTITSSTILMVIAILLFWLNMPFAETAGSISVFILTIMLRPTSGNKASIWCRKQSIWMFLIHMYILTPICLLGMIENPWLVFSVCTVACMILSQVLISLSHSKYCCFLNNLT